MQAVTLLSSSQEPATGPYVKPVECNTYTHSYYFNIILTRLGVPSGLFP